MYLQLLLLSGDAPLQQVRRGSLSAGRSECCLVMTQLFFAALFMLVFAFPYIHIGSLRDLCRWCVVVPFYCGMLLTSILALKNAPMSLVIVLRNASPLAALVIERFYPEPLRLSMGMLGAIVSLGCLSLMATA
eukprot:g6831.t1